MRDLLDELDTRLTTLADAAPAADDAAARHSGSRRTRTSARQRRSLTGGALAAGGAVAAVFALTGTSAAELPIFSTPSTDATAIQHRTQLPDAGIDLSQAHSFRTPAGPGYAVRSPTTVCLISPDPAAPGEYGAACDGPPATVERRGLQLETRSQDGRQTTVALLLPSDAHQVRVMSRGRAAPHTIDHGVVVADLPRGGTIRWSVDDRPSTRTIDAAPSTPTEAAVTCPDGRMASIPSVTGDATDAPGTSGALEAARRQACAR